MKRLQDKRVIITGAASGIGRAAALLFAAEGARLVLADLDADGLEVTAANVREAGGTARSVAGDVGDEAVVQRLVSESVSAHGGLDVMFANAGITGSPVPLLQQSAEEWERVLRVNLIGAFLAVKAAAAQMQAQGQGGSVVCTASVAGLRFGAGDSAYSASKAGVISLVQTAANQLSGTGIRVNGICPGLIETGMTKVIFDYARARGSEGKIGQLNPLRRAGRAQEIAQLALFLASDESSYVNGQAIAVDGGLSSSHPVKPGRLF